MSDFIHCFITEKSNIKHSKFANKKGLLFTLVIYIMRQNQLLTVAKI